MPDEYLILRRFDAAPDEDATVTYDEMARLTRDEIMQLFSGDYRTSSYMFDKDMVKLAENRDWPDGTYVLVDLDHFKPITLESKRTVVIADPEEIPF